MKILFTTVISGFLFISVSVLAADYSQTQNKVDDKMNSPKPAQGNPTDKDNGSSKGKDSNNITEKKSQPETYEKQKVQKLEKDEGRYQQLKKDADPRGRTEENKENFDTEVPRGAGVQYPPAKDPNQPN